MVRTLLVALLLTAACGSDTTSGSSRSTATNANRDSDVADDDATDSSCIWGVDELLAETNFAVEDREDCGNLATLPQEEVALGFECLQAAIDLGAPAELTINFCIDCAIPSTFICTSSGEFVRIELENDLFGDGLKTATVERCADFVLDSTGYPHCESASQLYRCQEPRQ